MSVKGEEIEKGKRQKAKGTKRGIFTPILDYKIIVIFLFYFCMNDLTLRLF